MFVGVPIVYSVPLFNAYLYMFLACTVCSVINERWFQHATDFLLFMKNTVSCWS